MPSGWHHCCAAGNLPIVDVFDGWARLCGIPCLLHCRPSCSGSCSMEFWRDDGRLKCSEMSWVVHNSSAEHTLGQLKETSYHL